jgi:hypothetical protein
MHNQHLGLSEVLAEQRRIQQREQATHIRLTDGARQPSRRSKSRPVRRWWQRLGRSKLPTVQPSRPPTVS